MYSESWTEIEEKYLEREYQRLNIHEIMKHLSRSKSSIYNKAYKLEITKKTDPNLSPSPVLAYILGVLKGDGWISNTKRSGEKKNYYRYFVHLQVADLEFAQEFKESLIRLGLNPLLEKYYRKEWRQGFFWRVSAHSKKFVNWYKNLGIENIEKIAEQYPESFVRGFYDSEGCLVKADRRRYIQFSNTDESTICLVRKLIGKIGFRVSLRAYWRKHIAKKEYSLFILGGTKESKRFLSKINPSIQRKVAY